MSTPNDRLNQMRDTIRDLREDIEALKRRNIFDPVNNTRHQRMQNALRAMELLVSVSDRGA